VTPDLAFLIAGDFIALSFNRVAMCMRNTTPALPLIRRLFIRHRYPPMRGCHRP